MKLYATSSRGFLFNSSSQAIHSSITQTTNTTQSLNIHLIFHHKKSSCLSTKSCKSNSKRASAILCFYAFSKQNKSKRTACLSKFWFQTQTHSFKLGVNYILTTIQTGKNLRKISCKILENMQTLEEQKLPQLSPFLIWAIRISVIHFILNKVIYTIKPFWWGRQMNPNHKPK